LTTDEPLARIGNIYKLRRPVWERGIENINFVIEAIKKTNSYVDFNQLVLIGHSNGGDISMLFATKYPDRVKKVISLDHLRMPIPRSKNPRILSIRAKDTQADEWVIPNANEQQEYDIRIVALKNGNHSDLCDHGSEDIKQNIIVEIEKFLTYK
jgi:dienelactone hydrolase